jgi:hypothetical protein
MTVIIPAPAPGRLSTLIIIYLPDTDVPITLPFEVAVKYPALLLEMLGALQPAGTSILKRPSPAGVAQAVGPEL